MPKATFLANPETAIKNAPLLPVGTAPLASRNIFNVAQLQSETATIQNTTLQNITSFIAYRYLCRENKAGSTNCSYNNELVFSPGVGKVLDGDIYAPATGDNSYIFYAKAEKLGTYTISTGATSTTSTTTSTTTSGFSCTTAPTVTIAAPTSFVDGVNAVLELTKNTSNVVTGITVTNQGSGYTTVPPVTVNVPNGGTCTPYTPSIKATLAGGKITGASLQVLTPTVEVARGTLEPNKLYFAVIDGGAGYTTPPTVTL